MMTALLCMRNIVAGRKLYEPWQVNQDAEYIEEGAKQEQEVNGLRLVSRRVREEADPSPRPAAIGRKASRRPGRVA